MRLVGVLEGDFHVPGLRFGEARLRRAAELGHVAEIADEAQFAVFQHGPTAGAGQLEPIGAR